MTSAQRSTFAWWLARLPQYNLGLIAAGLLAYITYVLIGILMLPAEAEFEVTFFTIVAQGMAWLLIMLIANTCYFIGPVSESVLRPEDAGPFRERWYKLGCRFSFALPFASPALLLLVALLNS